METPTFRASGALKIGRTSKRAEKTKDDGNPPQVERWVLSDGFLKKGVNKGGDGGALCQND